MRTCRFLLLVGLALALSGFSDPVAFDASANVGGAGYYTFTGSVRSHGMTCAVCHQGSRPSPGVQLDSSPVALFEQGYTAGEIYKISVTLTDEQLGLTRNGRCADANPCNRNSFVVEMLHNDGRAAGRLCPVDHLAADGTCTSQAANEVVLIGDGAALGGDSLDAPELCTPDQQTDGCIDLVSLRANGRSVTEINNFILAQVRGQTQWQFLWRAPLGNDEPVHLFLGLVDGDGGSSVDPAYGDYAGDSVTTIERVLYPVGSGDSGQKFAAPTSSPSCAMFKDEAPISGVVTLLAFLLLIWIRRQWAWAF